MKLRIVHDTYGCDSGCCGHRVETQTGDQRYFKFEFNHADGSSEDDVRSFAEKLVGTENLDDVDFEASTIYDYMRC